MAQLEGKVCIITGAAGSIGYETAKLFVAEGARVMLVDRNEVALRQGAEILPREQAGHFVADVGDAHDVEAYVNATAKRWGAIDVVVSNAGNLGPIGPIAEYPDDAIDEVYRVHVKGAFLACKYALPRMRAGGAIIITSSVAGLRGDPGPYAYIAAKHAQVGLMRSVAKEAARQRVRVNTIHPGPTRNSFQGNVEAALTPMLGRDADDFFNELIPLGRHAEPSEIARAMLFLASEQSSFITGSALVVDGGMSA